MITVKLMGGLGNQMFQYAVGRSLSVKLKTKLKVIFIQQLRTAIRPYKLNCFSLIPDLEADISDKFKSRLLSRIYRQAFSSVRNIVKEKSFAYDPTILDSPDGVTLEGYFQSDKYFKIIENIIRSDFTFKYELTGKNKEISKQIKNSNSVSLHIRRGDYVNDKATNAFHGTPGLEYYSKAAAYLEHKNSPLKYFVFSDDIGWAKENLSISNASFIDWNVGDKDYIDMQLMSLCKHNIIANSSFSWWGAWLNRNLQKIVIAPKHWFKDKSVDTRDLIPRTWIKI